jgi:HK97 family phage major capsid protein
LRIVERDTWDGAAAKERIFRWAGWPDDPAPQKARKGFLVYDADDPTLKGSYKLPFADVVDGSLVAVDAGLRAAASRLPQADLPPDVKERARALLDAYFERMKAVVLRKVAAAGFGIPAPPSAKAALRYEDYQGAEIDILGVPFGGPIEGRDRQGEVFLPETDIMLAKGDEVIVTYYHGIGQDMPEVIGKAVYRGVDDRGHWFRARLDPSNQYAQRVYRALDLGIAVRASSGTVPHLVRYKEGEVGVIAVWPVGEIAVFDVDEDAKRIPANDWAVVKYAESEPAKAAAQAAAVAAQERMQAAPLSAVAGQAVRLEAAKSIGEVVTMAEDKVQVDVKDESAKAPEPDFEALVTKAAEQAAAKAADLAAKAAEDAALKAADKVVKDLVGDDDKPGRLGAILTDKAAPAVIEERGEPELGAKGTPLLDAVRALARGRFKAVYIPLYKGVPAERYMKALAEGTDTAGGYLVPPEYATDLIELLQARAVVRRAGASVIPMGSDTLYLPKLTGGATAYWLGENSQITASDQTFGQVALAAKKLAALTKISNDLIRDANPAVEPIVRDNLVRTLRLEEDIQYLRGDGSSNNPTGIRNLTSEGVTVTELGTGNGATPDFDDLADAVYRLDAADAPQAGRGWIVHPRTVNTLRKIKDSNNQYLWADPAAPGDPPTVWGYPVYTTTQIPINLTVGTSTDCSEIYLGAWGEALIGQNMALELRASDEAGNAFEYDQTFIRAIMRVAFAVRHGESFEVLTGVRP